MGVVTVASQHFHVRILCACMQNLGAFLHAGDLTRDTNTHTEPGWYAEIAGIALAH